MGLRRMRRVGLALALAVLAVCFAVPASASAARILYADGHPLDATRLATFGGNTAVDPPGVDGFDGCSDAEWATALARTDFDVLVVGENAPGCIGGPTDLSPGTLAAIANYVRGGKPIIVLGAHTDEAGFLNAVFGFNTTNVFDDSSESAIGTLQPSAAGTPFAGGPPTVTDVSATELLSGTPGTTIYSGPEGIWAFMVPFGSGVVTYLGWDFCEGGCATFPNNEDDWYRVLDRALKVNNAFTIVAIRRNKKKGTATITGNVQFPGELIASGKGAKTSAGGAVISKSVGAGQARLVVKAKGKKKRKLNQKGKAKVKLAITYTATGGSPRTQSVKVKLKKKLKKK